MTNKQKSRLLLLEWFIPSALKSGNMHTMGDNTGDVVESPDGVDPDEAFMDYQSSGLKPDAVTDLNRFNQLKHAQRHMSMMEKMWREDLGKIITVAELKERDDSFSSDEQYEEFCKWVDKTFGNVPQFTILEDSIKEGFDLLAKMYATETES